MEYYYENKLKAIEKKENINKRNYTVIGGGPLVWPVPMSR